jgi:hypothetical protein
MVVCSENGFRISFGAPFVSGEFRSQTCEVVDFAILNKPASVFGANRLV